MRKQRRGSSLTSLGLDALPEQLDPLLDDRGDRRRIGTVDPGAGPPVPRDLRLHLFDLVVEAAIQLDHRAFILGSDWVLLVFHARMVVTDYQGVKWFHLGVRHSLAAPGPGALAARSLARSPARGSLVAPPSAASREPAATIRRRRRSRRRQVFPRAPSRYVEVGETIDPLRLGSLGLDGGR